MLEKAAELRLFVEMMDQGLRAHKQYAVCRKAINARKASVIRERQSSKVLVASCCHLFHKGCLQAMHESEGCPICSQLLLSIRTVKAAL